jgi:class 3 adenylate cyclase/predicted esterase
MAEEITRRLAAVLAADIAGYTRLMELDTDGTVAAWHAARADVIDPAIVQNSGRIVKHTGDGFLAEFPTAESAVNCAIVLQDGLAVSSLDFRIGVNLGDIIDDGEDIHGEGVNVAARLEGMADSGGICVSGMVYEAVRNRIDAGFEDLGEKTVKNVSAPVRVYRVGRADTGVSSSSPSEAAVDRQQDVRFCTAPDGVNIAYATVGRGPPLVKAPNWMTHLEFEWNSPVWRHFVRELSRRNTLVRFDQRGNGLSDRNVEDVSFEAFVSDLETVTDALQLDRFPLLGASQGCAISIAYAVRHPDRVSQLILYGGFIRGSAKRGGGTEESDALNTLIKHGWGKDNPALRQNVHNEFDTRRIKRANGLVQRSDAGECFA